MININKQTYNITLIILSIYNHIYSIHKPSWMIITSQGVGKGTSYKHRDGMTTAHADNTRVSVAGRDARAWLAINQYHRHSAR